MGLCVKRLSTLKSLSTSTRCICLAEHDLPGIVISFPLYFRCLCLQVQVVLIHHRNQIIKKRHPADPWQVWPFDSMYCTKLVENVLPNSGCLC